MQNPHAEPPLSGHFQVVTFKSVPLESASSVGGRLYTPHQVVALNRGEAPTFSVEALVSPGLTVGFLRYSGAVHIKTPNLDDAYHVNIPLDGPLQTASGDQSGIIPVRNAALYRRGQAAILQGWNGGGRVLAIKIAPDLLEQRAADIFGHPVRNVDFKELSLSLDNPRGHEWLSLLKVITNGLSPAGSLTQNPVMGAALQEAVISGLVLLAAGSSPAASNSLADLNSANVVQQAIAYMDRRADQPITISSLAGHLGVSIRSLQTAFRAELDITPHEHLRAVRLGRARQDLLLASARDISVAQVARRWGFSNLGRFAAHYSQVYGESPKDTLRNSIN